jgi:large subunit ribosomal protein L30
MSKIAIIRIRGCHDVPNSVAATLRTLKLNKKLAMVVKEKTPSIMGMLKSINDYVTWGELNQELQQLLQDRSDKVIHLKPPAKGFKAIKSHWPKGDLGYRGDKINELIKRMI